VLLLPRDATLDRPVWVAYDGSAESRETVREAGAFARAAGQRLTISLHATSATVLGRLEREARSALGGNGVRFERSSSDDQPELRELLSEGGGHILVLDAERFMPGRADELLRGVSGPVLLVRASRDRSPREAARPC
jgi:hypothetical protein